MKKASVSRWKFAPLAICAVWISSSLLPYALGEDWGSTWFLLNLPLSVLLKAGLWLPFGKTFYVVAVTLLNGGVLFCVSCASIKMIKKFAKKREDARTGFRADY